MGAKMLVPGSVPTETRENDEQFDQHAYFCQMGATNPPTSDDFGGKCTPKAFVPFNNMFQVAKNLLCQMVVVAMDFEKDVRHLVYFPTKLGVRTSSQLIDESVERCRMPSKVIQSWIHDIMSRFPSAWKFAQELQIVETSG